jgi:hypothetical protein
VYTNRAKSRNEQGRAKSLNVESTANVAFRRPYRVKRCTRTKSTAERRQVCMQRDVFLHRCLPKAEKAGNCSMSLTLGVWFRIRILIPRYCAARKSML